MKVLLVNGSPHEQGTTSVAIHEVEKELNATEMLDFVEKYVLFDDVLTWERDIMHYGYKQVTFTDLICNPPQLTA